MGTITGIGDLDPVRWPNSHWRSVKVTTFRKIFKDTVSHFFVPLFPQFSVYSIHHQFCITGYKVLDRLTIFVAELYVLNIFVYARY